MSIFLIVRYNLEHGSKYHKCSSLIAATVTLPPCSRIIHIANRGFCENTLEMWSEGMSPNSATLANALTMNQSFIPYGKNLSRDNVVYKIVSARQHKFSPLKVLSHV